MASSGCIEAGDSNQWSVIRSVFLTPDHQLLITDMRIRFDFDSITLDAELFDTPTARAIAAA
jgi:hypothetical protein